MRGTHRTHCWAKSEFTVGIYIMFLFDLSLPSFHCMYPVCRLPLSVLRTNAVSSHVLWTDKGRLNCARHSVDQASLMWTDWQTAINTESDNFVLLPEFFFPPLRWSFPVCHTWIYITFTFTFTLVFTSRSYGTPPPPPPPKNTIKPDLARFQVITEVLLKTGGFFFGGGGDIPPNQQLKWLKVGNALWYGITSQKTWIFMLNFISRQVPL